MKIEILLDDELLNFGVPRYVSWDTEKEPHIIVVGNTGSGKTYLSKLILGKISKCIPESHIYVCDYKGDKDFEFLANATRFFRYANCQEGLQRFYDDFLLRQSGADISRTPKFLFFDEFASYINSLDKKAVEEEKKKLSSLLMLGRSFDVHIIVSQQRADAQYFATARDNFNLCIALGNISSESKEMLFNSYKKQMKSNRRQGTGYMLVNGTDFKAVQVPRITDVNKLHNAIKEGVMR